MISIYIDDSLLTVTRILKRKSHKCTLTPNQTFPAATNHDVLQQFWLAAFLTDTRLDSLPARYSDGNYWRHIIRRLKRYMHYFRATEINIQNKLRTFFKRRSSGIIHAGTSSYTYSLLQYKVPGNKFNSTMLIKQNSNLHLDIIHTPLLVLCVVQLLWCTTTSSFPP